MNYCIECKFYHYNTAKKAFECSISIGRICEVPCDSYVEDDMVWVKVPRKHGRLINADELIAKIKRPLTNNSRFVWESNVQPIIDSIETAPTVLEASDGE